MFRTIWEFAQSADCVSQVVDIAGKMVSCFLRKHCEEYLYSLVFKMKKLFTCPNMLQMTCLFCFSLY